MLTCSKCSESRAQRLQQQIIPQAGLDPTVVSPAAIWARVFRLCLSVDIERWETIASRKDYWTLTPDDQALVMAKSRANMLISRRLS